MFWADMWKIRILSENFQFIVVKFSKYLKKETDLVGIEWLPFRIDRFSEGVCVCVWGGGGGGLGEGAWTKETNRKTLCNSVKNKNYQVLIHGTFKQWSSESPKRHIANRTAILLEIDIWAASSENMSEHAQNVRFHTQSDLGLRYPCIPEDTF